VTLAAILISYLLGESLGQLRLVPQVRAHIPSILIFIFYTFFIGPFPEELGWLEATGWTGLRTGCQGSGPAC